MLAIYPSTAAEINIRRVSRYFKFCTSSYGAHAPVGSPGNLGVDEVIESLVERYRCESWSIDLMLKALGHSAQC